MFLQIYRRQLSPEPGESGGNNPLPTLEDLDEELDDPTPPAPPAPPAPPKEEGDGDDDKNDPPAPPKEDPPAPPAPPKEDDKGGDGATDDLEEDFWADVDKLRGGDPLDIDFGDVDPISPEGALIRENAVVDRAIGAWETELQEKFPEAYAFLDHMISGGTKEEFFETAKTLVTLPTEEQLENDPKIQEEILQRNMTRKGMSDKVISSTLKALKTDDALEEASKEALKEEGEWEKAQLKVIADKAEQTNQQRADSIKQINKYVDDVVATGEVGNLVLPEADRKGFAQHLKGTIRLDGNKWVAVTELTNENVQDFFKKEFFGYKKGNLKSLVERQARTENTNRLRATIKDKTGKSKGSDGGDTGSFIPLGEIDD
jgi:hypothetical protein